MSDKQKDTVLRSLRLPVELDERLVRAAEKDDRSVSYVIRKALEAVLVPEGARTPRKALTDDELVEIPYEPEKHRVADPAPGKRNPMRPAGASRTQRDANAEYARMMAERQARMEKGR